VAATPESEMGFAPSKGVNTASVPGSFIMPEGCEIDEIWIKRSYESNSFFKNQAWKISGLRLLKKNHLGQNHSIKSMT